MKTQDEIVKRINERMGHDILGFEWHEYLRALDFDHAKPFLKETVTEDSWGTPDFPNDEAITEHMKDYMSFAWDKACSCRGISAGRSIAHYQAWLWLVGEDELAASIEEYEYYGKDELRAICDFLGLDASQWDDDVRVNSESDLY